jgi:hypothetical protein
MGHLVLLGDSIFDNASYVAGGPAVVDQVRRCLPAGWAVTLRARDGDVISDVLGQLGGLPGDATHLAVSAGGNDILGEIGLLQVTARTVGQGLELLADVRDRFDGDYRRLLAAMSRRQLPALVCTIYNGCLPDARIERQAAAALGLFNDRIISLAREAGLPIIDLRAVCTENADFANPIEPSSAGGAKIAQAIGAVITGHDFGLGRAVLFP